ncbi:MAG: Y-family DNA polymerase [Bacteroidales bacterium]|nr:Y-family DNA polymerase [Bacteroidales bacterium]
MNSNRYYAVVDCDNCFASCERVFRPDLVGKPVVVLSNNDGCVVARSREAKQMGIKAGTPYFKLAQEFPGRKIAVFSSNYELYGDLTGRVMAIICRESPHYLRYSIDEAFVFFDNTDGIDLRQWGLTLHSHIKQYVGMPVSIGIAPNKTLAKMASHFAKHYAGYRHCCLIDSDTKRKKALSLFPVEEVWGIGRRHAAKLRNMNITNALQLAEQPEYWIKSHYNIVMQRTWRELNGEDCVPDEVAASKKSICVSRSFPDMIDNIEQLRTYVSNYAARCAEKLRKQSTAASVVGVFLSTNQFRDDLPQYGNFAERRMLTPSNSTITIVKQAMECLNAIYKPGYRYKKAGVVVISMEPGVGIQTNLLDYNPEHSEKLRRLDKTIDKINKLEGSETVIVASQQYQHKSADGKAIVFADAIRHEFRSPHYSTRWTDIIELH